MKLNAAHKVLIAGVSVLALIFAGLAALALVEVRELRIEKEKTSPSQYVHEEEAVVVTPEPEKTEPAVVPLETPLFEYVEVIDGCGVHFEGECLNARSGPGLDYPVVAKLRNAIVLKVTGQVERGGITWYKIVFDEKLRYPERVTSDWYVAADYVRVLKDEGVRDLVSKQKITTTKRIVVDRAEQMLYAYDGETLFMEESISTGIELNPTPSGTFVIYRKTPTRYMQGPIPGISDQYWDLPGVPWNLYFSYQGDVIHGAYWHNNFGRPSSHGCVNLRPATAEKLYAWADLGTKVTVK